MIIIEQSNLTTHAWQIQKVLILQSISSQIVCNILNVCYFQNVENDEDESDVSDSEVCSDTMTTDTLDSLEETDVSDDDDVDWELNSEDDVDSSASDDENNTVPKNVVR